MISGLSIWTLVIWRCSRIIEFQSWKVLSQLLSQTFYHFSSCHFKYCTLKIIKSCVLSRERTNVNILVGNYILFPPKLKSNLNLHLIGQLAFIENLLHRENHCSYFEMWFPWSVMTTQWTKHYSHIQARKTSNHKQNHTAKCNNIKIAVLCPELISGQSSLSDFYQSLIRSQLVFNSKYRNWTTFGLIFRQFISFI